MIFFFVVFSHYCFAVSEIKANFGHCCFARCFNYIFDLAVGVIPMEIGFWFLTYAHASFYLGNLILLELFWSF